MKTFFPAAVSGLVYFGMATSMTFAQAPARKNFGKGTPFKMEELPAGKLKSKLETLNPEDRKKAMKWLHTLNFQEFDAAEHLRADDKGGIFSTCPDRPHICDGHDHAPNKEGSANQEAITSESIPEAAQDDLGKTTEPPAIAYAPVSINSPPAYNSKPGATRHIYLDFNGALVSGKAWSKSDGVTTWTSWDCVAWSTDADPTTFSDSEQANIRRIYERVAEDYAPFDVNVTTDIAYDPINYTGDKNYVGWVLFSDATDRNGAQCPHYGYGGVAYTNVFGNSDYFSDRQPAWVLTQVGSESTKMAEAASHEMGHNMGLTHDGLTTGLTYYGGHFGGSAPSWAPLMGAAYTRDVTQWSKSSEYYLGNQAQDDLAIISAKVPYRTDDHGDTSETATLWLSGQVNQKGIVETTNDPDVFAFDAGAGSLTFNAKSYRSDYLQYPYATWGGNLDILLELYDESLALVASDNPLTETNASITFTVPANGRYYLVVKPTGAGGAPGNATGYTAYGSLGQYTVTGNFLPLDNLYITSPEGGQSWLAGSTRNITWASAMGGNVKIELFKGGILNSTIVTMTPNDGSYSWTIPSGQTLGNDYKIRISSVENPLKADESLSVFTIANDPLGIALETTGLSWTGTWLWVVVSNPSHDGVDSAQTEWIAGNQTSNLETTLAGPGTLTFWWKVSSEANVDYLRFYLNGVEQGGSLAKISGEVDWVQKTVTIPAGNQTIRWAYSKNGTVNAGTDRAWVDEVVFTPVSQPEIAVEQPVNTNLTDGESAISFCTVNSGNSTSQTFTLRNTGSSDLTGLAITKSGTNAADYTAGTLSTATLAPGASTTFSVTFAPSAGVTGARTAAIQIANNDANENPFEIHLTGIGVGPGYLAVTPAGNFSPSGAFGGPFTATRIYTLSNPGYDSVNWTVTKTADWVTLSSASGTLEAGASTTVTVSINAAANSLNPGGYSDTVTFTSSTTGTTTRGVLLTVNPIVTYHGNSNTGGSVPVDTAGYAQGATVTVLGNIGALVRSGYSFSGWNTAANGSGTPYTGGDIFVIGATNVTLYAKWNELPVANAGAAQTVKLSANQPWTPASLITAAWYDADDAASITHSSGAVSQWNDKSGNGKNMVQGTGSRLPVYTGSGVNGRGAITFDGIDDTLSRTPVVSTKTTNTSVFIVSQPSSASVKGATLKNGDSYGGGIGYGNGNFDTVGNRFIYLRETYQWHDSGINYGTSANMVSSITSATNIKNYLNGNIIQTVNALVGTPAGTTSIGGYGTRCFSGAVVEVIMIDSELSMSDRQKIEGYLAHKWGLISNLSTDHPYKASAPSTSSATATLAGTASDAEGATLTTSWSWVSGPANVTFSNTNSLNSTVTFPVVGTYTLVLTVNDGLGQSTSDVVITVNDLDHFDISSIGSPKTVGTAITDITLTAKTASNTTVTSFTGTVTFGGTAGVTGTSANFIAGVLTGVSVTPTQVGTGLTITVNDGASHTGSATFNVQSVYSGWSSGTAFDVDSNGDGITNGMAWLLGAANSSSSAAALMPTFNPSDAAYHIYTFRRSDAANADPRATIAMEYSTSLSAWTTAVHDGLNIIITPTNDFHGAGVDKVEVKIKKNLIPSDKLFCRLKLVYAP